MIKTVLNSFLFILVFFFTMEVCSRIDDSITYDAPFLGKYSYEVLITNDNEGIRHNIPNARFEKWQINSLGFRGPEADLDKSQNQIRIVIMGASETFGLYENPGKEWPSQLAEMLKANFPNAEIVNTSVLGLPLTNLIDYTRKYVLPLSPDIAIVYQGFFTHAAHSDVPERDNVAKPTPTQTSFWVMVKRLVSNFRFFPKMKETIKKCLPESLLSRIRMWRLGRQVRQKEKTHLMNREPMDTVLQENISTFEKDLTDLIFFLKKHNIIPILSTYPTLVTSSNKYFYKQCSLDHRRFFIELSEDGLIDASIKFNDAIKRVAKQQSLLLIDNNGLIEKTSQHFADYVHYTDRGATTIAKNFYDFLNHTGLLNELTHSE